MGRLPEARVLNGDASELDYTIGFTPSVLDSLYGCTFPGGFKRDSIGGLIGKMGLPIVVDHGDGSNSLKNGVDQFHVECARQECIQLVTKVAVFSPIHSTRVLSIQGMQRSPTQHAFTGLSSLEFVAPLAEKEILEVFLIEFPDQGVSDSQHEDDPWHTTEVYRCSTLEANRLIPLA